MPAASYYMSDAARAHDPDEPARQGRLSRLRAEALAFSHPDPHLVEAWVAARDSAVTPLREQGGYAAGSRLIQFEEAALAAFSALAIGAREQARTRIAALAAERSGLVIAWPIGRYYALTGDLEATSWLRPALEALRFSDSVAVQSMPQGRGQRDPLLPLVAYALLPLAEATGDRELATSARQLAAGADPGQSVDSVLCRLADISPAGRGRPLEALSGLFEGETEAGASTWETILRASADGEGSWIVPILVAGILGLDPDADRGRLRLRLHAPAAWPSWSAENIRVGDATITVSIQRDDESVAIRADQTAGAMPLTLILEPTIQAPVAACFVDDTPADLAVRPSARHVVVPVQLALDAPRELRIALGPR